MTEKHRRYKKMGTARHNINGSNGVIWMEVVGMQHCSTYRMLHIGEWPKLMQTRVGCKSQKHGSEVIGLACHLQFRRITQVALLACSLSVNHM